MTLNLNQSEFRDKISSALASLGATEISFSVASDLPVWSFEILHQGVAWSFKLVSEDWDFNVLPSIFWNTSSPKWAWPHISRFGDICISDREGLDYDPDNVGGICSWVLDEALRILINNHALTADQRAVEFSDELEGYLQNLSIPKVFLDESIFGISNLYAEVSYKRIGFKSLPFVKRINTGGAITPRCQQEIIEVVDVEIFQVPEIAGRVISQDWWEKLNLTLTLNVREKINASRCHGVLFRVKNSYGHALFLIHWGKRYAGRPYGSVYLVQRRSVDYLINRTGQDRKDKNVTIIGCGAVGSRVAEHLTLAAVKKITLIDQDKLAFDNIGRHVLGGSYVGQYKVKALAVALSDRLPGVEFISIPKDAGAGLTLDVIRDSHVIVLATGNAPVERAIIRRAFKERWGALVVSTSVEAGGLGGHAISMRPGVSGCLECLYVDSESLVKSNWMRTSLIKPGQKITKQLTGCGGFTPYSSLDATKTAILAVEFALSGLVGYKRWVGYGELALLSGIEPSDTHQMLLEHKIPEFLESYIYAQEACLCCGN